MNFYPSSPSNTANTAVNNENDNPPPSFSSPPHIWQQPVPQEDFNPPMIHVPSQSHGFTPTVSQDHFVRSNAPLFPQPSIYVNQQLEHRGQFSVQGDAGPEVYTPPQHLTSAAVPQHQIAHADVPTPPLPHHVYQDQDIGPVQGGPSHLDAPLDAVSPIQTETPADEKKHTCLYCNRKFKRSQELMRHLQSNLPDFIHCPIPRCPWTGRRRDSLMKHMKNLKVHPKHPGRGYERKEYQIYNPKEIVPSMARGAMALECAVDMAHSRVKKRFEMQDKAGVKASVWGKRRKLCTERSQS